MCAAGFYTGPLSAGPWRGSFCEIVRSGWRQPEPVRPNLDRARDWALVTASLGCNVSRGVAPLLRAHPARRPREGPAHQHPCFSAPHQPIRTQVLLQRRQSRVSARGTGSSFACFPQAPARCCKAPCCPSTGDSQLLHRGTFRGRLVTARFLPREGVCAEGRWCKRSGWFRAGRGDGKG